jgi:glycosyltransferase involved in cell wall biosynthesis
MKILMVAPQPFFEPRGTPFSVLGRLRALSALGHEVDLVTYHIGEDVQVPGVKIFRTLRIPFITQISIGPSMLKLFLDGFLLVKTLWMLLTRRYDLLHTHEEASFFGFVFARLFGLRHLYDMHSSLPQQLKNFEYTKLAPMVSLFGWFERRVIDSSHAVITICPALKSQVETINTRVPHVMIENVATEGNPDEVTEEACLQFRQIHGLVGKRIVLYTGTFEPYQGLDLLIEGAQQVVQEHPDVMFLLMGGKPAQFTMYQQRADELGLQSFFRFIGMRPPKEVPIALKICEVLVSPRSSGTNTPLKIYGYLQSGKPIVATNLYTHTQVLSPDAAMLVDTSPEAFGGGISTVLSDRHLAKQLGAGARQLFEAQYSYQNFINKTDHVLQMAMR